VSGFPGARGGLFSYCNQRVANSSPPKFGAARYAEYVLTPGGRFAFSGQVAILTDGRDYSAADYFPLAAKYRSAAILVGAPTAGAFGASGPSKGFQGPPRFRVTVDPNRCTLADDDMPLEGRSVAPQIQVDYDPMDLKNGKDTFLERAVTAFEP
jgi:C-terminal processing protease CtpA/Prc